MAKKKCSEDGDLKEYLVHLYDRIYKIRDYRNISTRQLTIELNISSSYFTTGPRDVAVSTIYSITTAFPEISLDWLITGKGEMIREGYPVYNENEEAERVPDEEARQEPEQEPEVNLGEQSQYPNIPSETEGAVINLKKERENNEFINTLFDMIKNKDLQIQDLIADKAYLRNALKDWEDKYNSEMKKKDVG